MLPYEKLQRLDLTTEASIKVTPLFNTARKDALARIKNPNFEIQSRIENALKRRFLPYIIENEIIASQLETQEYKKFIKEIDSFLGAKVGIGACPDGRVSPFSLVDPRVASVHRRLQGLPETRESTTEDNCWVLNDPDLAASITTEIQERIEEGKNPELIEFLGPHIDSQTPKHGCGACIKKFLKDGRVPDTAMLQGGIAEYFNELGEGFYSFDKAAEFAGGKGTTFDLTHDSYSQGFIVGLRDTYSLFDPELSLRQNLTELARNRKILMTESLDRSFGQMILDEARKIGANGFIDTTDYTKFGFNAMLIGRIAKKITIDEETKGYKWIPDSIKEGKSETAIRVLAYHALRNVVYRTLGEIIPGQHTLQQHPEQLSRTGPIGSDYNTRNIAFVHSTPRGRFTEDDIDGTKSLYDLSYDILREQGTDLTKEGRIILVTGIYEETHHANKKLAKKQYNEVASVVLNNAAWIRKRFKGGIQTGDTIVIACLFDPLTKRLTHVLESRPTVENQKEDVFRAN